MPNPVRRTCDKTVVTLMVQMCIRDRRERAQTETIYIQAPDKKAREEAQTVGQTHMEILDFLLGLLNVFHIGE